MVVPLSSPEAVIPAQAGIQRPCLRKREMLDRGLRRDDAALRAPVLLAMLLVMMFTAFTAFAQANHDPAPLQFQNSAEERRFHALAAELRCVMCQNQSLADSNAMIARDLRVEVLELMRDGMSDAQIKTHLVQRYGDFVLYKPRVESKTWLLWFGPALLLLAGGFLVYRIVRSRSSGRAVPGDDAQEW